MAAIPFLCKGNVNVTTLTLSYISHSVYIFTFTIQWGTEPDGKDNMKLPHCKLCNYMKKYFPLIPPFYYKFGLSDNTKELIKSRDLTRSKFSQGEVKPSHKIQSF